MVEGYVVDTVEGGVEPCEAQGTRVQVDTYYAVCIARGDQGLDATAGAQIKVGF